MKRDQRQIDKLKEDIDRITKMMADQTRSAHIAKTLDIRRQKYQTALKILTKH
jgi:DNA-directed RNA polymerase specialized sigma subunit